MSRYKVVDNIRIKLTAEEEVARDKEEENAAKAEKELKLLKLFVAPIRIPAIERFSYSI